MAPPGDLFGVGADEDFDDVIQAHAEAAVLTDAENAGEEFLRDERAVVGLAGLGAVVAGGAVINREFLPEVGEEFDAAAAGALGVVDDLPKLGAGNVLLLFVGDFIEEVRLLRDVAAAEEEQAIAGEAVAAGATGFLIVALDIFGQVVVDDPADIGFVDAHAEGDGRADDPRIVAEKLLLIFAALGGGEAGVVGAGGETAAGEGFGDAFGGGAARAVNDAALVFAFADEIDDLFRGLILRDDAVGEVRAVEAGHEGLRIVELQVLDDVGADTAGGGGGERHHGDAGESRAECGELAIFWAEIVAPFGDAVGLVDGDAGDIPRF